jgi:glycosyltransferase involved in cell wall biosynthesis
MKVSVVVCTYTMDRYDVFTEAVDSVLAQTYDPIEVVLVIDGNPELYERAVRDFGNLESVVVYDNDKNRGISYSRTRGAELASGEIVAFIDDDGVAEEDWVGNLVEVYEETDAIAVGGQVLPDWQVGKPEFFPEEFYWLVGCDEKGFGEHMEEMRNTYGSNISYRREVLLKIGGYDQNTGRRGDKHIQAHESTVGARIRREYGRGVIYNTDAKVHHKLFEYRGNFWWLASRSFWQGYSKRIMDHIIPEAAGDKNEYLAELLTKHVPERLVSLTKNPELVKVKQLVALLVFTAMVGFGYVYAILKPNLLNDYEE